ncbi:MAG: hypothetical protein QJT81_01660 [Candidatus Thiothrix putei]|uniref:Spore coat protein U domain-containing protein n=1 Tax=Candidatus Thiothrix putei TaxID=3080811 RepID=A0AA95KMZ6_9GAMM|nr:MAG: hypothetical protein QJT81_01660 [Candidatus Thiothrix putei]
MMPFHPKPLLLLISCCLLAAPATATRMACTDDETAQLPVKVEINVPAFLFLQVGNANQTAELTYNVSANLSSGAYTGAIPPAGESGLAPSSITGSDVSNGVNVAVRANCGQVKIAYRVTDNNGLANNQGQFIPYETLQTSTSDSGLPAPTLRNAADAESLVSTSSYGSVTDRQATWQYTYTNSALPAAGTYQGTVTYQASCL